MLQSTSQQSAEKIQKPEHLKWSFFSFLIFKNLFLNSSYNPHNSGGRAISPIIESFGEDLDSNDSSSDKIVQNLVTRFENMFDVKIYFLAFLKNILKYFERKQHQLNANWENFHKEMAKFNQQKIHEWAKMVDIRFGLQSDEYKAKAEKDFDKIKELELEV